MKQSSQRLSTLAARYISMSEHKLLGAVNSGDAEQIARDIRSLAASVLVQDQTPRNNVLDNGNRAENASWSRVTSNEPD